MWHKKYVLHIDFIKLNRSLQVMEQVNGLQKFSFVSNIPSPVEY